MARKMLILDDPFLQNCIEVECVTGQWAAGENDFVASEVEGIPVEGVGGDGNSEEQDCAADAVALGAAIEDEARPAAIEDEARAAAIEDEARAAAIEELLKEVNVGEESYKTPTKGKCSVAISVEVEEFANVEVSLPPPTVGMVFDSWQKIDEYFRNYGKQEGFGVVRSCGATIGKGANAKDKRNVTWTCECYGLLGRKRKKTGSTFVSDSQICEEVLIKRKSKKVDCDVQLNATVNKDGDWVIKRVHLEHAGHNPTPSKSKNITKFRKKFLNDNPHLVQQLLNDRRAGVPVAQIFNCMARQRNGRDNMQFTQQDLHEEVAKKRKEQFEEGDTKAMFAYFKRMLDDNSNFFHTYRVDDFGRLQDVLWVDARSRVAYEEFGDVVVFDSTYLTNEYKLPFCNFVGVNHHGQTILFGCALVSRETSETFEWVFSNWLRCMGEKKPIGILTDQDPAMRKALKVTMKESTHRWCIWHITQKFGKKLGKHPNYPALHEDLENAIYDSLDSEEFEINWLEVIKKHELESDEWLTGLYEERQMWVPVYLKHLFWAGMKTTQRVESIHRFFDGYLSRHTLLFEFVERYVDALEVRCTSEKRADDNNERYVRQAYSDFPAELVFQKVYTDAKFKEVQRECSRVMYVSEIRRNKLSDKLTEHVVEDRVWYKPKNSRKEKPSKRKREYKLLYDSSTKEVSCGCRLFDCAGIICRHMIKVYEMSNCYEIPDKYILRRWRKYVIRKHTRVKVCYHDPNKTAEVCRFDKMMVRFGSLCSKASAFVESTTLVMQALQLLELQVDEKIAVASKKGLVGTPSSVCKDKGNDTPSTQRQGSCDSQHEEDPLVIPKDPPLPKRPAHRTTDSRYKSCLEKPRTKAKKCKTTDAKKKADAPVPFTPSSATTVQPTQSNMFPYYPNYQYSPHSAGGIQMVDMDGSIGYFTSVGGGVQQFNGSQISPQGAYFPFANAPYPIPLCGWRSPMSPASAASRQGGFVPILPRPRPPATPPPTPGASVRS